MKHCRRCDTDKDESEFSENKARGTLYTYCKPCNSALALVSYRKNREKWIQRTNDWRKKNPERFQRLARESYLKRTFGITHEQYQVMYNRQSGCCAICGSPKPGGKGRQHFSVDHDHATGKVRALLCTPCNVTLGVVELNPGWLASATAYLEKHVAKTENRTTMACKHGAMIGLCKFGCRK